MHSFTHILSLTYIFISIIWQPFQIYYLHVDGAGRIPFVLSIAALILNLPHLKKYKDVLTSPAFVCWTLLTIYAFINSLNKGIVDEHGVFYFLRVNFISPYIFLLILTIELADNHIRCIKMMMTAFFVYLIICLPYLEIGREDRIEVQELGNIFSLQLTAAIFVACVLSCFRKVNKYLFLLLVLVALYVIIIGAARKAIGASAILLIGWFLSFNRHLNLKSIISMVLFASFFYYAIDYVLDHTILGERIIESEMAEDLVFSNNKRVNEIILFILGDRAPMYMTSYEIFLENKLSGIGICNYSTVSFMELRLHTEYMVQLCENGLIGFALFVSVYMFLIKELIIKVRKNSNALIGLFGLLSLLFINITTWTYSLYFAMIFYALLFNFSYNKKMNLA